MNPERLFNILFGLSCIGWAVAGLVEFGISPVRISVCCLNLLVGILFLFRQMLFRSGTWRHIAWCLPSFILCGVIFRLSPITVRWSMWCEALFVFGTGLTILSFLSLGRSMSIMPAIRSIVRRGPYGLIRHPAYLGEWLMMLACVLATWQWFAGPLLLGLTVALWLRIRTEESLLRTSDTYVEYAEQVRWRVLPGVW